MTSALPHAVTSILKTGSHSPLVRLRALEWAGGPALYAKCEFFGLGRSLFDRAALTELVAAHRAGHLDTGRPLFAAGGSDAVVSLAMAASAAGNPLTVLIPQGLSPERRQLLIDYGAALVPIDDEKGFEVAQETAFASAAESGGVYIDLLHGAHVLDAYTSVATEIVQSLGAVPTLTVCGLDLGAIPTGLARGLAGGRLVAVEPENARIGSGGSFGPHLLGGLAPGPEATALDRSRVTEFEAVDDATAWAHSLRLETEANVPGGIVSGAILAAGVRRARDMSASDTIVLVLPDHAERRSLLRSFFPAS